MTGGHTGIRREVEETEETEGAGRRGVSDVGPGGIGFARNKVVELSAGEVTTQP